MADSVSRKTGCLRADAATIASAYNYLVPEDRTVTITVTRKNLAIAIAPLAPADAA